MTENLLKETSVDLGFLEQQEAWLLTNKFFPSKVGGRPAWLELKNLPTTAQLKCSECHGELTFMCQVYAPVDDYDYSFHRTIYLFTCTNSDCWQPNSARNILVLRSQLARVNEFYDTEQASEEIPSEAIRSPVRLCNVCGARGPLSCGKCKKAFYCGSAHQRIDWSQGQHKSSCGTDATVANTDVSFDCLFKEYELVMETECVPTTNDNETSEAAEKRRLQEYEDYLKNKHEDETLKDVPDEEFSKYAGHIEEDVIFEKFQNRVRHEKTQVLRFERGASPLWITDNHRLDSNAVPPCERCGAKRIFEFQIMPQLLLSLQNENLDWGIIAIYTCEKTCDVDSQYVKEFAYKQDILNDVKDK